MTINSFLRRAVLTDDPRIPTLAQQRVKRGIPNRIIVNRRWFLSLSEKDQKDIAHHAIQHQRFQLLLDTKP